MSWFTESNRWKHFVYAIPFALFFTFFFGAGLGFGMEFKDQQWGGKWDWLDLGCTLAGSLVGQLLQIVLIYVLFH